MRGFQIRKAVQALNFIANTQDNHEINKMRALKLMWLADRLHLRTYGRTITGDNYVAMKLGPVASQIRNILQENAFSFSEEQINYAKEFIRVTDKYHYQALQEPNLKVFSQSDIEVLNNIIETYRKYTQFELSEISHYFPEWKKFESCLKRNPDTSYPVDLADFFEDSEKKFPFFETKDEQVALLQNLFLRKE